MGFFHIFNLTQTMCLHLGLMAGSMYCAYLISLHEMTVGDFVLFGTYMMQLMQPLNQLSMFYRTIQEAMIDMENMFDLMNVEKEIKDVPGALTFSPTKTDIVLDNVSFHYDIKQPILKNISLKLFPIVIVMPKQLHMPLLLLPGKKFYELHYLQKKKK